MTKREFERYSKNPDLLIGKYIRKTYSKNSKKLILYAKIAGLDSISLRIHFIGSITETEIVFSHTWWWVFISNKITLRRYRIFEDFE